LKSSNTLPSFAVSKGLKRKKERREIRLLQDDEFQCKQCRKFCESSCRIEWHDSKEVCDSNYKIENEFVRWRK
jgi:hypothetical protein